MPARTAMTLAGELRGQYQIVRLLGRSPYARVYVVRDLADGHLAALKVIEPPLAGRLRATGRLLDARALAAARPPGIVAAEALGTTAEGTVYVATTLFAAGSLATPLERGPLPCVDAVLYCFQVGMALCEARARGIVHGGVKPSNVFVVSDPMLPRGRRALLADFGTAGPRAGGQAPGGDAVDLGSLLFEIATGEPYAGEDVRALMAHGLPSAVARLIVRAARRMELEELIDALAVVGDSSTVDPDPTESNMPLRAPRPVGSDYEPTTPFTRV
jgi:serine/threonine protein kinase